jgi:hypothetical protein
MEKETEGRAKRLTMMVRSDLTERVLKLAPVVSQNPNSFVNLCVEGCLDAMEAEDIGYEIPIIKLYRTVRKKAVLDSKWVTAICSIFAPRTEEVTEHHHRFLAELINQHEGPLTAEAMNFYWKKATEMNMARIQTEKEAIKFKTKKLKAKHE